ncbi:hypothetical protein SAMN05421688_1129 [Poseidonocella pacifica]|uniref:Uncharacterized protein n=1 Tax=Poseidonocella pacifica TaxID=871651 RepID=A0A1I0W988_9RHOB|nr:DUF1489 domain-containing protein [Poseidonocella pacifica]SFA84858.1 hypothetical protein SAMN05421688_1129 [Poseidonocella pacifica]
MDKIHLVKLCVGAESIDDLLHWQASGRSVSSDGMPRHVTRMWPKQETALLNGGSIFWVIKGIILARQPILRLEEVVREDGISRCGIVLDRNVVQTRPAPRRPFQGWRYLKPEDAPADLPTSRANEGKLPAELDAALAEIGVL